jgi:tripartite-type tricarboxylate transporter receptor subunit TctC
MLTGSIRTGGRVLALALGLFAVLPSHPTAAQSSQPIRFVIGTPPGGAIDIYIRQIMGSMTRSLGQTIVIENKPGANGNLAAQQVNSQPADGRTVWVGTAAMTEINPSVYSNLPWKTEDFTPIIKGIEAPLVFVVHPRTLDQVVAWVKANPGKLGYASFSPGTPSAFLGHQFNKKFGLDLNHIPYPGSGPQMGALLSGEAKIAFTQVAGSLEAIKDGKLTAIATTGTNRYRALPQTPSFAELGHADLSATIWFGLLVRAATPAAEQERLLAAAKTAHADPEIRAKLEAQGFDVSAASGPALAADIKTQIARWAQIVQETGFKAD